MSNATRAVIEPAHMNFPKRAILAVLEGALTPGQTNWAMSCAPLDAFGCLDVFATIDPPRIVVSAGAVLVTTHDDAQAVGTRERPLRQ